MHTALNSPIFNVLGNIMQVTKKSNPTHDHWNTSTIRECTQVEYADMQKNPQSIVLLQFKLEITILTSQNIVKQFKFFNSMD